MFVFIFDNNPSVIAAVMLRSKKPIPPAPSLRAQRGNPEIIKKSRK
jgi:hypothetical protein